jgi:AcrR family transcriptional regulator
MNVNSPRRRIGGPSLPRDSYHHGDLRIALIKAAEQLLAEQGIEAFSLRAAARLAGVSPAAPAYHFGDAAGLLTEIAIQGFEELTRYLIEWTEKGGADPLARLHFQGQGYIRFALANRARFQLMFRRDKLRECERLAATASETYAQLQSAVCRVANVDEQEIDEQVQAAILASWSTVHGFAHLAIDGQFQHMSGASGADHFFDATIPLMLAQLAPPAAAVR